MKTFGVGLARLAAVAALATATLLASAGAAAQSRLFFISQAGDAVGDGQVADLREDQGWSFVLQTDYEDFAISAGHTYPDQGFFLRIGGPGGAPLVPGVYENAVQAHSRGPADPGIQMWSRSGSCSYGARGRFVVHEAVHANGVYTKLAADFEQQCEFGTGRIFGQIRFASSYPVDTTLNVPDPLVFPPSIGEVPGSLVQSTTSAVWRIEVPVPISTTGAEYSLDDGPWTSAPGMVSNGQNVRLRLAAPAVPNANTQAMLTVGPVKATWKVGTLFGPAPQPDGVHPLMVVLDQPTNPNFPGQRARDRFYGDGGLTTFGGSTSEGFSVLAASAPEFGFAQDHSIRFAGPSFTPPALGYAYTNAVPWQKAQAVRFTSPAPPAVGSSYEPVRECDEGTAQFTVHEAVAGAGGAWSVFAADFAILCLPGTSWERTVRGYVRIGSSRPIDYPVDTVPAVFDEPWGWYSTPEARPGAWVVSAATRPDSYNAPAPISIVNGEYSLDGGPFTDVPGTIAPGQNVRVRVQAPAQAWNMQTATVTIGGVTGRFGVQATPGDETPDAFSFPARRGVAPGELVESSPALITGIDGPVQVGLGGGGSSEMSIGCTGLYVPGSVAVSVGNNTAICVRHPASLQPNGVAVTYLTVGSVTGVFLTRTRPTVAADSGGDGRADLVWRDAAGGLSWWAMDGPAVTAANYLVVDPEWTILAAQDFDGDGHSDFLWWRPRDGALYLWLLEGHAPRAAHFLGAVAPGWTPLAAGDLDGDGRSDLLWRHQDGTVLAWLMDGASITSAGALGNVGAEWIVIDLADFDGNGTADILWQRIGDGAIAVWHMDGLVVSGSTGYGAVDPAQWLLLAAADFDGDGIADLLWRSVAGEIVQWMNTGAEFTSSGSLGNPGTEWSIRAVADLDGDGKADLVWRHTDGSIYWWKMDGTAAVAFQPISNPGGSWEIVAP